MIHPNYFYSVHMVRRIIAFESMPFSATMDVEGPTVWTVVDPDWDSACTQSNRETRG